MNGGTIFLIVFVLVLLGLAVTFLVLWLINRNKQKENNPNDLVLTGLDVRLTAPDTVTATWTNTGSSGNQVTLYADTQRIELDSAGKPVQASKNLITGGPVSEATRTVSANGLLPNVIYYIDVVVTGDNRHKAAPAIVWTGTVPSEEFVIQELNTGGGIQLNSDNVTVSYQKTLANKNNNDLWSYNPTTFKLTGNGTGGNTNPVLYNNSGTLAASSDSNILTSANSNWVYNPNGRNAWCLQASPDLCLQVPDLSAETSPVQVASGTPSKWLNKPLLLSLVTQ